MSAMHGAYWVFQISGVWQAMVSVAGSGIITTGACADAAFGSKNAHKRAAKKKMCALASAGALFVMLVCV